MMDRDDAMRDIDAPRTHGDVTAARGRALRLSNTQVPHDRLASPGALCPGGATMGSGRWGGRVDEHKLRFKNDPPPPAGAATL
eukprot:CAMPEP_0185558990 /NCGR_PEP_ID=MMETSP1381-20130426/53509_1 /TAXON_ID=298111 /ORGANISM="Pavlova sp., Strain CCMP459" /LENGTH=82 /DNA_ID=CAMNT_0028172585 /DNA_START=303 /DNA_END=552 /DNA_ORIENTATION=+